MGPAVFLGGEWWSATITFRNIQRGGNRLGGAVLRWLVLGQKPASGGLLANLQTLTILTSGVPSWLVGGSFGEFVCCAEKKFVSLKLILS